MALGAEIVLSVEPKGVFTEGYVAAGEAPLPGMVVQMDPTVALQGRRHTWKIYNRAADGDRPYGPLGIVLPDHLQGRVATTAYAAGERMFIYTPVAGEHLNMLVENLSGTTDDHAAGEELMISDGTGKLIAFTGTPQTAMFVLLETITDPTADTLAWVVYSGY